MSDRIEPTDSLIAATGTHPDRFAQRHIGPREHDITTMLDSVGYNSLEHLTNTVVPDAIQEQRQLKVPAAKSEGEALNELRRLAGKNQAWRSYIGMGYYGTVTPAVIRRSLLENPGWYTQYTPYQAEISQGRLESLLNYQTMISDLTGLPVSNCSLLDEASAAAEAVNLAWGALRRKADRNIVFVSQDNHPQTIEVITTRCEPLGLQVVVGDPEHFECSNAVICGVLSYPNTDGSVDDHRQFIEQLHQHKALAIVCSDLLALTVLTPPGEFGADVVIGNTQRFGVPLFYGGPHAAFMATGEKLRRLMPGRIIGISKDKHGKPALRMAMQSREQHIRREKATSNICTAQALLANVAAMYAVYHGPEGLLSIAKRVHTMACTLHAGLKELGFAVGDQPFFDTVRVNLSMCPAGEIMAIAEKHQINLRLIDSQTLVIALDETVDFTDVFELLTIFNNDVAPSISLDELRSNLRSPIQGAHRRNSAFLQDKVFHTYHSETEMLRYLRRLERRDISLVNSMIALGSCTMKLNGATQMEPVSWPGFADIHPFAPPTQTRGYQVLFQQLEQWLADITGFAAVSLQPNAGSQGEYAGLLAITGYHQSRGDNKRNICLIPTSAHGTNPASAVMAGLSVIPVACDDQGNISVEDLKAKAEEHSEHLAALMITYPSTHGVFEAAVRDICQTVHDHGGQVYMDGANMNAQVGLCSPGGIGADVCHLNLHKTFAIPHGGGGPGVGPIGVAQHLAPFLPGHSVIAPGRGSRQGAVAAAPWGSAGILPISWSYCATLGPDGLKRATEVAILNANYIAKRLSPHFPVLYTGEAGLVAHECIIDLRPLEEETHIGAEDVAKRLMDYGFHAPTMSFPVAGTLMIEPTESESLAELDRFCDAMIAIHGEIMQVKSGTWPADNNPLSNAPTPPTTSWPTPGSTPTPATKPPSRCLIYAATNTGHPSPASTTPGATATSSAPAPAWKPLLKRLNNTKKSQNARPF